MLKEQIKADTTEAQKTGDEFVVGTLRMLLASIITKEKDKRYKISGQSPAFTQEQLEKESGLSDEEILDVISSEVKKRKDAIVLYEKGNRPELADREKKEIEVLKKYLPEQLSPEELKKLVEESIVKVGAKEIKDPSASSGQVIGKIMADLMPKVKGKADGGEISKIVKELLSKQP